MSASVRGISRIKRPEGIEDDAVVRDVGGNEWSVSESTYRSRGYEPPFDDLPWQGGP